MNNELKVGIIGNGKMGQDIFNYIDAYKLPLTWIHKNEESAGSFREKYFSRLLRQLNRGMIDQDDFIFKNKNTVISGDLKKTSSCSIIIEAISEDAEKKSALFDSLFNVADKDTIICTNTSSLNIAGLCNDSERLKNFIGIHFFYPIKFKNIAEISLTGSTDAGTADFARHFLNVINKNHITLDEKNNFILNRIFLDVQAFSFIVHETECMQTGEIDYIIDKYLYPLGTFELFDHVGIDIIYNSVINYTDKMKDKNFYMPMLDKLKKMINEKKLGIKTKKGFYEYENKAEINGVIAEKDIFLNIKDKFLVLYINGFYKAVYQSNLKQSDLNNAVKEYLSADKGPLELLKENNITEISAMFDKFDFGKNITNYCRHFI